jgi:hypothetical protein
MNWNIAVGDIFIYLVPFTDKAMEKPRPVLVVSEPNSKGDIMVLAGSSRIHQWNEPWQMVIQQDDLRDGRLDDVTVFPRSTSQFSIKNLPRENLIFATLVVSMMRKK